MSLLEWGYPPPGHGTLDTRPLLLLTPSGSHQKTYGWQVGGMQPTSFSTDRGKLVYFLKHYENFNSFYTMGTFKHKMMPVNCRGNLTLRKASNVSGSLLI